jgi:hypothetical protein
MEININGRVWRIVTDLKIDAALKAKAEQVIRSPRNERDALMDFFGMSFNYKGGSVQLVPCGII